MREKTFAELIEDADFDMKVRYSHLDDKLIEIDDILMNLYEDQICRELDIKIAEEMGEVTVFSRKELDEIERNIDYFEYEYEVVHDFYDEVLFEILGGLEIAR